MGFPSRHIVNVFLRQLLGFPQHAISCTLPCHSMILFVRRLGGSEQCSLYIHYMVVLFWAARVANGQNHIMIDYCD